MLGVDRLDMIKGIPQKLVAFEKFLEGEPQVEGQGAAGADRGAIADRRTRV